jgi:glycosyltransferase involved in cell wall biosynthesis
MKILFLDQSGDPGGAELCLIDIAELYRESCLVILFADGEFRHLLEARKISVKVLSSKIVKVRKDSGLFRGMISLFQLIPLLTQLLNLSHDYELIYANTPKALIVGSLVGFLKRRPLVYHLHDILSNEHFSWINRQLAVGIANHFTSLIIANSHATAKAFEEAGGSSALLNVVYNGFDSKFCDVDESQLSKFKQEFAAEGQFLIGHFSRLGPWKGQHVLLEALVYCPENVIAIFVGGDFFGVDEYVEQLQQRVDTLQLNHRVKFLGFRANVPQLMSICDLITHTSIAPEPFGRVIVEAMLCGKPVIAANAGGAVELIEHGITGWLTTPGDSQQLAKLICQCQNDRAYAASVASAAQEYATQNFSLSKTNQSINELLNQVIFG